MKIKDLEIEVFKGINFKNKLNDGLFRIIPSGANFPNRIKYNKCKYVNAISDRQKKKKLISGDILFNTGGVGTLGRSSHYISDEIESYCDGFILVLRTLDDRVYSKFLFYMFQSEPIKQEIINNTRGTTGITSIRTNAILNFEIPFPNIKKQKEIVEILDQAFESIEKAKSNFEKNIENAKELFQSKLNQIFSTDSKGWESKTLKQISVDFGRGKSKHRPRNDKKLYNGEYPFIQTGDVRQSDKLIISYSKSYNEVGLAQSKLWPKNTICITIAANIAESAILDFDACFPDSIIGVVVDSKTVNHKFLYYSLQFFKQDLKKLGKGSAQDNINLGTFENHFFNFPNTTKQKEIVETLDIMDNHIQSLLSSYEEELKNLEELKKSILEKAFNGELTNKSVAV